MNTGYNKIFKYVHNKKTESDLIPIKDIYSDLPEDKVLHIQKFIKDSGRESEHFFYSQNSVNPYVYYNPPYYYSFIGIDGSLGELSKYEAIGFKQTLKKIEKFLESNNYSLYFMTVEGPYDLLLFRDLFDKLSGQEKYEVLTDLYVSSEYGHTQITRKMWEEAISGRLRAIHTKLPVDDDILTIYRGESSESTPLSEAMSWTLDSSVASRFLSYSTGINTTLYEARIKKEDIIDYFNQRNEEEIVCFPEDVFDVIERKQIHPVELYSELENNRIIDEFIYYRNTVFESMNKFQDGSHDRKHSIRVLLLVLALSELGGLSSNERAILTNAAIHHDSARVNDSIDTEHGEMAVAELEAEKQRFLTIQCKSISDDYELGYLSEDEEKIAKFIIKWHCIEDDVVAKELEKISNKERVAKLFNLFKDADALDRVRLRDLDINYLRTNHAKKLVGFAHFIHASIR